MTKILIDQATAEQALEALKEFGYHGSSPRWERTANDLKAALEQQQAKPVAWNAGVAPMWPQQKEGETFLVSYTQQAEPVQEPVSMRMPKVGDRIVCLEDESLGKVVSLTAGGSPDILFDDGSRGTYMVREFAELFGYVASPMPVQEQKYEKRIAPYSTTLSMLLNTSPPLPVQEQQQAEPVYQITGYGSKAAWLDASQSAYDVTLPRERRILYTTPPRREWVGLTEEEIKATWSQVWYDLNHGKLSAPDAEVRNNVVVFGEALEEKLRSKNHG